MMRLRTAPLLLVTAALTLLLWPPGAQADIYRHVDKDGIIHFSNQSASRAAGGQLYLRTGDKKKSRSGLTPFAPSDTSPERFSRFDEAIRQSATLYQIPEALVRAVVMVESNFDPRAVSHAGAQGLMQLMPETAARMEVRDSFDPRENIFGGVRYLRVLANLFNGDLELTVAGYNAGEGAVMRHGGIPPYEETQDYVIKVIGHYRRFAAQGPSAAAATR